MIVFPMTVLGPWGVPIGAPPPSSTDRQIEVTVVGDVSLIRVLDGSIMNILDNEGHVTKIEQGNVLI